MVNKLHTLKRVYNLLSVVILLLMLAVFRLTESMCGKPGISPNCNYDSYNSKTEYHVGETVTYYCQNNPCYTPYSMHRYCLENGSWSGTIPLCHKPALAGNIEKLLLVSGSSTYTANSTMDLKNMTCINTTIDRNTFLEAVFTRPYRVVAVKVLFLDRITDVSARVQVLGDNGIVRSCASHSRTDMEGNIKLFICPNGLYGNAVRIYPVRTQMRRETDLFEICEVYIFIQWNQGCLIPDIPYMATGLKTLNPTKHIFECNEEYESVGDDTVYCQEDGTWTQTSFKCIRRTSCGKLPDVANGVLISNSTTINSTAWLICNEGFRPLSDHLAHCLPAGMWTTLSFSCELITCDPTPVIPHGRAELPNGFTYGSKMHITCDQGYMAVEPEFRECHNNGSWGNLNICTKTTCGPLKFDVTDTGQWLPINDTISIRVLICQTSYHIEGSPAFTQCLPNGSWSHTTAVCRRTPHFDEWNSEWTPSTILIAAVAVGAGTAICILCLAMCCLTIKKRRQTSTNSSVFHVGVTDSVLYQERSKEQQNYKANTYEDVIELRNNPSSTKPRKPSSALPNLPIFPVDTDPVYAQPFETSTAYPKEIPVTTTGDIYKAHIYAEPVDSHRPPSGHGTFTSAAETWLRSGAKKFGRKMSLPGRASLPEDSASQLSKNIDPVHKPVHESSNTSSLSSRFDEKHKIGNYEPLPTKFSELKSNSIYLNTKEGRFTSKKDTEQLQMIDNDIYQDDYFSNV